MCFCREQRGKSRRALEKKESHWVIHCVTQAFPLIDEFSAIYGKAGQIVSSIKMSMCR